MVKVMTFQYSPFVFSLQCIGKIYLSMFNIKTRMSPFPRLYIQCPVYVFSPLPANRWHILGKIDNCFKPYMLSIVFFLVHQMLINAYIGQITCVSPVMPWSQCPKTGPCPVYAQVLNWEEAKFHAWSKPSNLINIQIYVNLMEMCKNVPRRHPGRHLHLKMWSQGSSVVPVVCVL